jgi:hypothetical protein
VQVCVNCGQYNELTKLKVLKEKYANINPIDGLYWQPEYSPRGIIEAYWPYPDVSKVDPMILITDYNNTNQDLYRHRINWEKVSNGTITLSGACRIDCWNWRQKVNNPIMPTGDPRTDRTKWQKAVGYPEWIIAKTNNRQMTPDFTAEDYTIYKDTYKSKYGKYPPNAILTEKDISNEVVSTYNNDNISDQEDDGGYDSDLSPYLNRLTDDQKDKFLKSLPCKPTKEDKKLIKTLTSEELGIIRQHRAGVVNP